MNELYATQQHKITNGTISQKDISENFTSLIGKMENSGRWISVNISIKELLLLRYICNNCEISADSKALLKGLGNNRPSSNSNQPVTNFLNHIKVADKNRFLAEMKDVKQSFDRK